MPLPQQDEFGEYFGKAKTISEGVSMPLPQQDEFGGQKRDDVTYIRLSLNAASAAR